MTTPMSLNGVSLIFDLDGTLVDTAPDLAGAMNAVLARAGRPNLPASEVRNMVGRGARVLIETGFARTGKPLDASEINAHFAIFIEHYDANLTRESRPFPGVVQALKQLKEAGAKLAVCTNKPQGLTVKLLAQLDLDGFFEAVLGADARPYKKPDPRHLLDCVTLLGGSAERAVMIGDSETDVGAARAAKVPVILVDYGYTAIPVPELGGDAIISNFAELAGVTERLLSRR
jgi:phosphoglycolate phosphatase